MAAIAGAAGMDRSEQLISQLKIEFRATSVSLYSSGTGALAAAIDVAEQDLGLDGAPVALPAYSCFAVAAAATARDRHLHFYDLDPATLHPSLSDVHRVLEEGSRVVVLAPLFGLCFDVAPFNELAASYGAILIEDACQALDAAAGKVTAGSTAPLSVVSFGRGKGWTGGSGGALLARGSMDALRNHQLPASLMVEVMTSAKLGAQLLLGRPGVYGIPASIPFLRLGETVWEDAPPPTHLSRASMAALMHTRHHRAREFAIRQKHALRLIGATHGNAIPIAGASGTSPSYLRLAVRTPYADRLGSQELRVGIARSYPVTLPTLPRLERFIVRAAGGWPGAEALARELVTLPTHSLLSDADLHSLEQFLAR